MPCRVSSLFKGSVKPLICRGGQRSWSYSLVQHFQKTYVQVLPWWHIFCFLCASLLYPPLHQRLNGTLKKTTDTTWHQNHNESNRNLEQHFPSPMDRPFPEKQTNIVYKINCADCLWSYIGETGRALETSETSNNLKLKHAWTWDHTINFDECKILDKANYRQKTILESWHTATTVW